MNEKSSTLIFFIFLIIFILLYFFFFLFLDSIIITGKVVEAGNCFPDWQCAEWSNCVNGYKYRNCIDLNHCSTEAIAYWINQGYEDAKRPNEIKPCNTCKEDWSCGEWQSCINGIQKRNCIDLRNCGTTFDKPQETKWCGLENIKAVKNNLNKNNLKINIFFLGFLLVALIVLTLKARNELMEKIDRTYENQPIPVELLSWIGKSLNAGLSKKEIEKKLKKAGWPKPLIDRGFEVYGF